MTFHLHHSPGGSWSQKMATVILWIIILTFLISTTVSSDVFKEVGSSFQLHITKYDNFKELKWMFETKFMLKLKNDSQPPFQYDSYKGRLDFDDKTFSVTLKNLTKTDSGYYTVKRIAQDKEEIITEHKLTVSDPVEDPVFLPPQQTKETCEITCRAQNHSISTHCYNQTCTAKKKESSNLAFSLHVSGTSVNCTIQNKVTLKSVTMEIKRCFSAANNRGSNSRGTSSVRSFAGTLFTLLLVLFIIAS